MRRALEGRPQAGDDLLGRLAHIEQAPLGVAAVDRDLLERLDQVGRAVEIGDQLLGSLLAAGDELVELRCAGSRRRGSPPRTARSAARSSMPRSG